MADPTRTNLDQFKKLICCKLDNGLSSHRNELAITKARIMDGQSIVAR